jgi:hypothetical protein
LNLTEKQREAVEHLARGKRGIAWWKVGEGKTRIALAWALEVCPTRPPRVLVVCSPGAVRTWQDEIALTGAQIDAQFLSYGMLSSGKNENRAIDFDSFNALIADELWLFKNHRSKRSRLITELSARVPTIGLSGSVVTARSIEDIFGQAKAVGLSQLIARNITDFRRQFCNQVFNRWGYIEWLPKRGAVEQIQTRLAKHVHVHFPLETREIKEIYYGASPSAEQLKIKRELVQDYFFAHRNENGEDDGFTVEVKSGAALLSKLQQVSDGSLLNSAGDSLRIESPKSQKLRELVSELLDAGERVLVWVAFRRSLELLHDLLGRKTALLSSGHQFDAGAWRSGAQRVCIATVGSGASLNDFAGVRASIFYSSPFSHLQNQQARGRTLRASSDSQGRLYYHLTTDGFPDKRVLQAIAQSRDVEQSIIEITREIVAQEMRTC